MNGEVRIETVLAIEERLNELAELLIEVVEDGASVGFLPPLQRSEAIRYWQQAVGPDAVLFVALLGNRTVGTVQLHLCTKQNGSHRAEIAKLMTSPDYRRLGIGRALMKSAEERARREERSLLVLDTREGDPSNRLYASLGYIEAGRIPMYAKSANGTLHATLYYFKSLRIP
jgi:ribosomal protein S18 acetylase RimI-like enzyme